MERNFYPGERENTLYSTMIVWIFYPAGGIMRTVNIANHYSVETGGLSSITHL